MADNINFIQQLANDKDATALNFPIRLIDIHDKGIMFPKVLDREWHHTEHTDRFILKYETVDIADKTPIGKIPILLVRLNLKAWLTIAPRLDTDLFYSVSYRNEYDNTIYVSKTQLLELLELVSQYPITDPSIIDKWYIKVISNKAPSRNI